MLAGHLHTFWFLSLSSIHIRHNSRGPRDQPTADLERRRSINQAIQMQLS
jgi:hypothetical protein